MADAVTGTRPESGLEIGNGLADLGVLRCPSWCNTDDHLEELDDAGGVVALSHCREFASDDDGVSVRLAWAELVGEPNPDGEQPELYVDIERDGATRAELRRWAAALLEAADFLEER